MAPDLLRALRATGADLPFGDPEGRHPGVRLESTFWRIVEPASRRVVIAGATICRDAGGRPWAATFLATGGSRGDRLVGRPSATALVIALGDDVLRAVAPFALVRLDAEPGSWALDARAPGWSAALRATSEGDALALPVPVPAERRTAPTTHQHQHGRLELRVRRGRRVAFSGAATLAGLELGRRAT